VTSQLAAVLSVCAIGMLLLVRHDARTWSAIEAGGGLAEALQLPFMMLIPGLILGVLAGVVAKLCSAALPDPPTASGE
jgi:hypothetical protein